MSWHFKPSTVSTDSVNMRPDQSSGSSAVMHFERVSLDSFNKLVHATKTYTLNDQLITVPPAPSCTLCSLSFILLWYCALGLLKGPKIKTQLINPQPPQAHFRRPFISDNPGRH